MHLLRQLYNLLHVWGKQDRIRSAPGIGKLLRLEAGRRLLIQQALYQVIERGEIITPTTLRVTYRLLEVELETPAQLNLVVNLARPTGGVIALARHSSSLELFYQDIAVLAEQ